MLVLNPSLLINQVHLGTAPSCQQLIFAASIAMLAYTGIETVSNMAEEAKDPGSDVPRAVNLVLIAVLGRLHGHLGRRALGAAGRPTAHGVYSTLLGTSAGGRYESEPVLGIVDHLGLHGALLTGVAVLRRPARDDDPVHRDQRRADRDLAAVVVARPSTASCRASSRGCTRPTARRGSRSSSSRRSRRC